MSKPVFSRREFLRLSSFATLSATMTACAGYPATDESGMPPQIPKTPDGASSAVVTESRHGPAEGPVTSPQHALQRLMDGNQRFVANRLNDPNRSPQRRTALAQSQQPFATILGCVDSRVPPELVFDRGLGDLFVIRTAGQVVDEAVLGSIEFGSFELKIPLIMVLGHERCGAIKASIEALEHEGKPSKHGKSEHGEHGPLPGEIGYLVKNLKPAIDKAHSWGMGDLAENAMRANVSMIVQRLKKSPVLAAAEESGRLKIVGGRYDLDSGAVDLLFS